ncbi:hypothetical protein J6590_037247 [Homalodisca vitripennis]|nr:hypothetical protein J6590_037247 [Homalodisca vitripennis]
MKGEGLGVEERVGRGAAKRQVDSTLNTSEGAREDTELWIVRLDESDHRHYNADIETNHCRSSSVRHRPRAIASRTVDTKTEGGHTHLVNAKLLTVLKWNTACAGALRF